MALYKWACLLVLLLTNTTWRVSTSQASLIIAPRPITAPANHERRQEGLMIIVLLVVGKNRIVIAFRYLRHKYCLLFTWMCLLLLLMSRKCLKCGDDSSSARRRRSRRSASCRHLKLPFMHDCNYVAPGYTTTWDRLNRAEPNNISHPSANNESSKVCGIIKPGRRVTFKGHRH